MDEETNNSSSSSSSSSSSTEENRKNTGKNRKKKVKKRKQRQREKFVCELCGHSFARNYNLKRHIDNFHVNLNQVFFHEFYILFIKN